MMAGLGYWYVTSFVLKMAPASLKVMVVVIAAVALVAIAVADYQRFTSFVVEGDARDLLNDLFREYSH